MKTSSRSPQKRRPTKPYSPLTQDRKLDLLANGPGKATAVNRSGTVGNATLGVEGVGMQQAPIGLGQPSQASMLPKTN